MRSNFFFFCRDAISRGGVADLARFPRLTLVDKWVGHQLASPADLPTIVTYMANGTYRLAISRKKILPLVIFRVRSRVVEVIYMWMDSNSGMGPYRPQMTVTLCTISFQ